MAYIFAGDMNALAGQRYNTDQQNIALAETDQRARQAAIDAGQANYRFSLQQQQQDDHLAAQQAYQFAALNQSQQNNAAQTAEGRYRWDVGQAQDKEAIKENLRRYELGETKDDKVFKINADVQKAREAQGQLKQLVDMINAQTITPDANVSELFPLLTPSQVKYAHAVSVGDAKAQQAEYERMAAQANNLLAPNLPKPTSASRWYNPSTYNTTNPPAKITEFDAIQKLNGIKTIQDALPFLKWDDNAQKFIPAITVPGANPLVPTANPLRPGPPTDGTPPSAMTPANAKQFPWVTDSPNRFSTPPISGPPITPITAPQSAAPLQPQSRPIMWRGQPVFPAATEQEAMARPADTLSVLPDGNIVRAKAKNPADAPKYFAPLPLGSPKVSPPPQSSTNRGSRGLGQDLKEMWSYP